MNRRNFLQSAAVTAAALATPYTLLGQSAGTQPEPHLVEASTTYGNLRGAKLNGVVTFKGVPYAGSVAGRNRFKQAPPLAPWTGVRDALTLGPPSIQPGKTYYGLNEPDPEEDCLVLNIWTPAADNKRRPVMFYNHGGGFFGGSAGSVSQDGASLARTYDVVVVATNHRLGLLGYLYLGEIAGDEYRTSGNQGLLDIADALHFVRANIAGFGGDPDNVMLFGESGGGLKTSCLLAMPAAHETFCKASIESGPGIRMIPRALATQTTRRVLQELSLAPSQWRRLLDLPVEQLTAVQVAFNQRFGRDIIGQSGERFGLIMAGTQPSEFAPVVDGAILPHDPFDLAAPAISKNKPLIVGNNRDEEGFFLQPGLQTNSAAVFTLTFPTLEARLLQDMASGPNPALASHAAQIVATYRASRPEATPTDLYIAIATARSFGLGSITIAERKFAQQGAPVFAYIFTHHSNYIIPGTDYTIGAAHATEIVHKFNNVSGTPMLAEGKGLGNPAFVGTDPDRIASAHNMSEMWTTFARTSHPGAAGQPFWPAFNTTDRSTMLIDATCRVVNDPFPKERMLWAQLQKI